MIVVHEQQNIQSAGLLQGQRLVVEPGLPPTDSQVSSSQLLQPYYNNITFTSFLPFNDFYDSFLDLCLSLHILDNSYILNRPKPNQGDNNR